MTEQKSTQPIDSITPKAKRRHRGGNRKAQRERKKEARLDNDLPIASRTHHGNRKAQRERREKQEIFQLFLWRDIKKRFLEATNDFKFEEMKPLFFGTENAELTDKNDTNITPMLFAPNSKPRRMLEFIEAAVTPQLYFEAYTIGERNHNLNESNDLMLKLLDQTECMVTWYMFEFQHSPKSAYMFRCDEDPYVNNFERVVRICLKQMRKDIADAVDLEIVDKETVAEFKALSAFERVFLGAIETLFAGASFSSDYPARYRKLFVLREKMFKLRSSLNSYSYQCYSALIYHDQNVEDMKPLAKFYKNFKSTDQRLQSTIQDIRDFVFRDDYKSILHWCFRIDRNPATGTVMDSFTRAIEGKRGIPPNCLIFKRYSDDEACYCPPDLHGWISSYDSIETDIEKQNLDWAASMRIIYTSGLDVHHRDYPKVISVLKYWQNEWLSMQQAHGISTQKAWFAANKEQYAGKEKFLQELGL